MHFSFSLSNTEHDRDDRDPLRDSGRWQHLTNGLPVAGVPSSFQNVGTLTLFGQVPIQVVYVIGIVLLFIAIQRYTSLGRYAVATGSNRRGAFLNGVPVRRTMVLVFALCGAAAGWGGVVYAARIGTPVPVVDQDVLFQVIVACVVGGTALTEGAGRYSAPLPAHC